MCNAPVLLTLSKTHARINPAYAFILVSSMFASIGGKQNASCMWVYRRRGIKKHISINRPYHRRRGTTKHVEDQVPHALAMPRAQQRRRRLMSRAARAHHRAIGSWGPCCCSKPIHNAPSLTKLTPPPRFVI
jgi:hypothetical protein